MMKSILLSLSIVVFSIVSNAQVACIDPEQIDLEIFCLTVIDPVCGCNGVTYNNECEAYYWYGVTSWTAGECSEKNICPDLADMDFGDCEAILGVGMVDGECATISGCSTIDLNTDQDMADFIFQSVIECEVACNPLGCIDLGTADFGECAMPLGYALVNGECVSLSGCSMTDMNSGLDLSDYFYEDAESCQLACSTATCLDLAGMDFGDCEAVLGIAMVNDECAVISGCSTVDMNTGLDMAAYFYESVLECQIACNPDGCIDLASADFGECDMVLGFAIVNESCAEISGCSTTDMITGLDLSDYFYPDAQSCQLACSAGSCIDLAGVDFGLCDFVLGVGIINGECVGISGCDYTVNGTDYTNAFFPNLDECAASCTNLVEDISLEILSIYPIPFTHEFQVDFNTVTSGNWSLIDLSGRVVLQGTIKSSVRQKIETQSLPKGLYFFSLSSENQIVTRKVVKE